MLPISTRVNLISPMLALALAAPAVAQTLYDAQVFTPVNRDPSMFATAMNEQGVIIGYSGEVEFDSLATPIAIINGQVLEGPKPTESLNYPLGLGKATLVVGTSSTFPYVWEHGVPHQLQPAGGLPQGSAADANTSGVICGEVYRDFTGAQYPVVWPHSRARGIKLRGLADARKGTAFAINENNQVAGVLRELGGYGFVAVRWDRLDAPPRPLGLLPDAFNSESLAINNLGDVAGRSTGQDFTEAFIYIDAQQKMVGLGNLGMPYSFARGINDAQQVVGEAVTPDNILHGFIWQNGVMQDLNDLIRNTSEPILYVSKAVAIDSQGRIAVEVKIEDGLVPVYHIALLTPVQ